MNLAHKPENEEWPPGKKIVRISSDSVQSMHVTFSNNCLVSQPFLGFIAVEQPVHICSRKRNITLEFIGNTHSSVKYVFAGLVDESPFDGTSMTIESLFETVCLKPCLDRKLGLVILGGHIAAAHANTAVPEEERAIVEGPNGIFRRIIRQCRRTGDGFPREEKSIVGRVCDK